jgi:hypothetical protein
MTTPEIIIHEICESNIVEKKIRYMISHHIITNQWSRNRTQYIKDYQMSDKEIEIFDCEKKPISKLETVNLLISFEYLMNNFRSLLTGLYQKYVGSEEYYNIIGLEVSEVPEVLKHCELTVLPKARTIVCDNRNINFKELLKEKYYGIFQYYIISSNILYIRHC